MPVPVLAWHPMRIGSNTYADNDHIALRDDLLAIHGLGLRVVPLGQIVDALLGGRLGELEGCVGLSFDDGSDFDYYDLPHPRWGVQRSMLNVMRDFQRLHGVDAQPGLHATSFSIVCPEARAQLDRTCMIGCRWWNDAWWPEAEGTGLLSIESHGWDHNHDTLPRTAAKAPRGRFFLEDRDDADAQIAQASRLLFRLRKREAPVLFAYPYGDTSDYLAEEYLPRFEALHRVRAAFTAGGKPVSPGTSRWRIPRFVFGQHWRTPAQLRDILLSSTRPVPVEAPLGDWRQYLRTWEVNEASTVAGALFRKAFGHDIPDYPRHFVLVYSPPDGVREDARVVAYVHQLPAGDIYLCGGMCVDERAYRSFPRWLYSQVKEEGGLATIVTRDSMGMLGEAPASFGHVGEPRARQADLRTGFVDTPVPFLMAYWRKPLEEHEKRRLIAVAESHAPF
jgi:hypothetical protein